MTGTELPDLSRLVVFDDRLREVAADRAAVEEAGARASTELARARGDRDFALQHLGKCLVEQGRAADAVPALEEALDRRRQKGACDLVASTTAALEWARTAAERPMSA